MSSDSMGNLEKLGILVIVILVVVVGVVAITPSETLFPKSGEGELAELDDGSGFENGGSDVDLGGERLGDSRLGDSRLGNRAEDDSLENRLPWPTPTRDDETVRSEPISRDGPEPIRSTDPHITEDDRIDDWRGTLRPQPHVHTSESGAARTEREVVHVVRPAPIRVEPEAPKTTNRVHVVQSGETLSAIAQHYLGKASRWRAIAKANPAINPDRLSVGDKLTIPVPATNASRRDGGSSSNSARTPETPKRRTSGRTYVVQSGDSLSTIAEEHLGKATRWRRIFDANREVLSDPSRLLVGMKLVIPGTATDHASVAPQRPERRDSVESAPTGRLYTVKSGDNLTRIAERELGDGERWRELLRLNGDVIADADDIKVGQKLRIR